MNRCSFLSLIRSARSNGRQTVGQRGFTIVELLIVIVVIGILAAITIVAYNGIQDRARQSKIQADINSIVKAIRLARDSTSKTTGQITGSYASGGNCWAKADGTDLAALPNTDPCIVQYNASLGALVTASGASIASLRDPWGRPYLIDENENEGGGCTRDTVAVYKQPFTSGFGTYASTPTNNVINSGYTGCAP